MAGYSYLKDYMRRPCSLPAIMAMSSTEMGSGDGRETPAGEKMISGYDKSAMVAGAILACE